MRHQPNIAMLAILASLTVLPSSVAEDNTRRGLGQQPQDVGTTTDQASEQSDSFYDLSPLTNSEKLQIIKKAYAITQLGDAIDWEKQRDGFRDTVLRDAEHKRRNDGNDDVYDGKTDDTLNGDNIVSSSNEPKSLRTGNNLQTSRRLNIDGDVFDRYEYSKGACPKKGSLGVPCAPDNLAEVCNKYDRDNGSFRACFDACAPGFCCIHDADRELNFLAPNCNTDENCAAYNYCYIAWWKLHDTIGPALFLQLEQDDTFYDIEADEIASDVTGDPLFNEILLHHFDDIQQIINDGTVNGEFNADNIFLDPEYWDTDI